MSSSTTSRAEQPTFRPSNSQNENLSAASSQPHLLLSHTGPLKIPSHLTGPALLHSPHHNKGTAFPHAERHAFRLNGLLPPNIQNLAEQVQRAYDQYKSRSTPLAQNTFMTSLSEQNTVLYYALLEKHLKEMFSVIYTPTEGEAIEGYSRLFRRERGCFLTISHPDEVEERMGRFRRDPDAVQGPQGGGGVDYIVVSDGEEILGIGDQGVGGILISVAKLVLMTACAGVDPSRVLPVVLDVGTDRESLRNDDLYLGLKRKRVRGPAYDDFVDRFVGAARKHFPGAVVHFEDFGVTNARNILDRYRGGFACFNDDIQGTGCVTLAAIMAALKINRVKLGEMRMLVFGSGSAGCGIAEQVAAGIAADGGKGIEEARRQIWCIDKQGLLISSQPNLSIAQQPFARPASEFSDQEDLDTTSLRSIIASVKPQVLIGTSTRPGSFTEQAVREMARHVDRPIIFPLSNPTRLHEAQPDDLYRWTDGKCLVATGSPFAPVEHAGKRYDVAECNNAMVFPGIGLGCVLSRAKLCSDKMLVRAVEALAGCAPVVNEVGRRKGDGDGDGDDGMETVPGLLPDVSVVRDVSVRVAMAVVRTAVEEGLATVEGIPDARDGGEEDELERWVRAQMWEPVYRDFVEG